MSFYRGWNSTILLIKEFFNTIAVQVFPVGINIENVIFSKFYFLNFNRKPLTKAEGKYRQ